MGQRQKTVLRPAVDHEPDCARRTRGAGDHALDVRQSHRIRERLLCRLSAIFAPTAQTVTAAIGLVSRPTVARVARAEFIAQRGRDYVQACRALGMRDLRIIAREILPNALPPRWCSR
ncbi:MAG: ABC transporter permease subunit [Candidatus Rokubacteria bacterium]|nr:ABC transporter permease subunit [Candidatus Rokubacteria bacterium]